MEMELCNFDTLSMAELLKPCKLRGLKADRRTTNLDLQVALRAFEGVPRWQSSSVEGDDDSNEKEGVQTEKEERESPTTVLSCQEIPTRPHQMTSMPWIPRMERWADPSLQHKFGDELEPATTTKEWCDLYPQGVNGLACSGKERTTLNLCLVTIQLYC
ncbi:hypothetical protein NDU88_003210 [Pleurodeles waltl]|uniref:Uncharacterized protein n=1 Tax=Pleurodeles waltl TaxID=8319 RepID=A0AAV7WNE4_PLEWA|nr:hypothetical protein NDU88_003210 [Pleurodeles waltl]